MKREKGIQSPSDTIASAMRSASCCECAAASAEGGGSMGFGSGIREPSATLRARSYMAADYSMQHRAVLITGAARRIGAAIARSLHDAGASVVLHCHRSRAEADALAGALNRERNGSAHVVQAELLDLPGLPRLVEEAVAAFGRLDGLVNNASAFFPTPLGSIDARAWDELMGSNLRAPFFLAQAAAGALRE